MSPRDRPVPKVVHASRPELGTGEVVDVVRGKPTVLQIYWPEPEKYGYYPLTELRRVRPDGVVESGPPALVESPE